MHESATVSPVHSAQSCGAAASWESATQHLYDMSQDQGWRLGSGREIRHSKNMLQEPVGGIAEDMRGIAQPVMDSRLSKGPDLARGRGERHLGSPGLLDTALNNPVRPLGSPALSILAQGRREMPDASALQRPGAHQSQHEGSEDRPHRSVSVDPHGSRSTSPADRNIFLQGRAGQDPVMSRLGRQKPLRPSLVPVELPPVLPGRATRLHQVCTGFIALRMACS